jgi:hypothetical protein
MPYIPLKDRAKFDPAITTLEEELINFGLKPLSVGELNFVVSSLIWRLFDRNPSYTLGNDLIGTLECVKAEFIRRRLNHYEDSKIRQNGDL